MTKKYPPPAGGGLIEAPFGSISVVFSDCIRRPRAAASLKLESPGSRLAARGTYPPPAGGGLIEA